MRVIQLLVTLQRGDAIGNCTLFLHDLLLANGFDTQIYAYHIGNNIDKKVARHISYLKKVQKDDLIIYHMCEGHMINEMIRNLQARKIAIYHNITPPEFFTDFGVELKCKQDLGKQEIASLKDAFVKCIAVSEFNKQDLMEMGYDGKRISVLPVILDFDDYKKVPDANIREKYNDNYTNILFVGRVVPNKKQEDIVRIFAYYHNFINEKSRLFLIGTPFIKDYDTALKEYIKYLNLEDCIIMPGHSSFQEILAYYSCADIFLCMSEHEGFCVPLVEAMIFNVPIIAYHSTAIPFTLQNSGVIVESKEPKKIASLIEEITKNEEYRIEIIKGQKNRLKYFEPNKLQEKYLREIKEVLGENI